MVQQRCTPAVLLWHCGETDVGCRSINMGDNVNKSTAVLERFELPCKNYGCINADEVDPYRILGVKLLPLRS